MPEPTPMKGSMFKKGEKRRNWLMRHFTLFNGALCYYATPETKNPKGFILTKDITECRPKTSEKVGSKSGKGEFCFEVVTKTRTYYFAPETAEGRDEWMAAIKSWIGYSEDVSTKELPEPGASQREPSPDKKEEEAKTEDKPAEGDAEKKEEAATTTEEAKTDDAAKEDKPAEGDAATTTDDKPAEESTAAAAAATDDAEKKEEEDAAAPAAAAEEEKKEEEPKAEEETPKTEEAEKKEEEEETKTEETAAAAAAAAGGDEGEKEDDQQEILKYRSEYDYDAQEDNELSFKEGDVVTVLDTFKGAGWWKAADSSGKVGLIPGNFFTKVE